MIKNWKWFRYLLDVSVKLMAFLLAVGVDVNIRAFDIEYVYDESEVKVRLDFGDGTFSFV